MFTHRRTMSRMAALFFAVFCACAGSQAFTVKASEAGPASDTVTAVIATDLHYTASSRISSLVIPGMAYIDQIADALAAEVISLHPDLFIMTGDNTNSGNPEDMDLLARKLRKIADAGIPVVMTTGNHDFDHASPPEYAAAFDSLCVPADQDSASLSYTVTVKNMVFFAMDDNSLTLGKEGRFPDYTMDWLEETLEKYVSAGYHPVFLSHHNVIAGMTDPDQDPSSYYRIQNTGLPRLLSKYHVRLLLTGHLHSQMIGEYDGMYEIIGTMPAAGAHTVGMLTLNENGFRYRTQPLDFQSFGTPDLAEAMEACNDAYGDFYSDALAGLVEAEAGEGDDPAAILDLIKRFFVYYTDGVLYEHRQELLEDPSWDGMIRILWTHNYGPWMQDVTENISMSSSVLDAAWE